MSDDETSPNLNKIDTVGDYSPGIVMGNYTVNEALTPASVNIEDAFKIRVVFLPSDKGYFTDLDAQKVFVNGCRFEINLGNAGLSDLVLRLFRISVEVEEVPSALFQKKKHLYGGIFTPHQLFIDLFREKAPGWWLLSEGIKHSDPRVFGDAREDILSSPESPRLQFRLKPGELEIIEGGLTPRDVGLFKVRFIFGVVSPTKKISRSTQEILILKGEAFHGG